MAEITVTVNRRRYAIACDDGQEEHVLRLAEDIDRRAAEMARGLGHIGDARLLLLVALVLADELTEARAPGQVAPGQVPSGQAGQWGEQGDPAPARDPGAGRPDDDRLRALARRIASAARELGGTEKARD